MSHTKPPKYFEAPEEAFNSRHPKYQNRPFHKNKKAMRELRQLLALEHPRWLDH